MSVSATRASASASLPRLRRALLPALLWSAAVLPTPPWGAAAETMAMAREPEPATVFSADSAEGRPISAVRIRPQEVYDTHDHGRVAPLHRLANRLHVRTRASTIRQQLLFAPGDVWNAERARETGRNLRALRFLEPRRIEAVSAGESVQVAVETRDFWSTRPEINLETSSGVRYGSLGFTERNLFGLGKSLSLSYRQQPEGRSRLVSYGDPALFGSRNQLVVKTTRGTAGDSDHWRVAQPFYAEEVRRAWGMSRDRESSSAWLYQDGMQAAAVDRRSEGVELSAGVRLGHGPTVHRLEGTFEALDRDLSAVRLEAIAPLAFAAPPERLRLRRFGAEWTAWRPRFVERVDIERLERIEDFDLGQRLALKVGWSPQALGGTRDEGFGRVRLGAGFGGESVFGWLSASGNSRFVPEARELSGTVDARLYLTPLSRSTVVLAAHGVAGDRMPQDFQVVTGGLDGLRGYGAQALAGTRLWRFNLEDRWVISPREWDLAKFGTVVFVDAARAWGLGAQGSSWRHDAGLGLRVGLPVLGVAEVLRVDVAWPISPLRNGRREPVWSLGSQQAF